MALYLSLILLVGGFILLAKGADWLIDGASSIARRLGISAIIVGLTIVALGTSLPELAVTLISAFSGNADLSIANVVGSNIMNIGLILGLSAALLPLIIKERTLVYEIPFVIVSSLFLLILSNNNNIFGMNTFSIGRFDGFALLFVFMIFFFYIFTRYRNREPQAVGEEFGKEFRKHKNAAMDILFIVLGAGSLFVGARLLVYAAVDIATIAGLSEKIIGLTVVAVGTSLPELFTCIAAVIKKQADIVVGNIVGSNIFNVLFVIGIVGLIKPITISPSIVYFDMVIMVAFSLMLVLFATTGKRVARWEGITFLAGYLVYIAYLFVMR